MLIIILVDNDTIQQDLKDHLERPMALRATAGWKILEDLMVELPRLSVRPEFPREHPLEIELLAMSSFPGLPFRRPVHPNAPAVLKAIERRAGRLRS